MAISTFRSRSQASAASIRSWSLACSFMRDSISSSVETSAKAMLTSSKRTRRSLVSFTPNSTFPRTSSSESSSGSWGRNPIRVPFMAHASPRKSESSPAMIFRRELFPEPLGPTTPILAPGKKERLMSFRISRLGGTILERRNMW